MSSSKLSKSIRRLGWQGPSSLLGGRLRSADPAAAEGAGRQGVRGDEGATLVEMAIVCSVLMAMLFGIFEISMALFSYHFVSAAAREATRFAIVRGANCTTNVNTSYCSPYSGNTTTGADGSDIANYVKNLGYPFATQVTTTTTWLTAGAGAKGKNTRTACRRPPRKIPPNPQQGTETDTFSLSLPFLR